MCLSFFLFFFFLSKRRPPRSTRTATLFPSPTLFRSVVPLEGGTQRCAPDDFAHLVGACALSGRIVQAASQRFHVFPRDSDCGAAFRERKSTRLNSSH